MSRLDSAIRRLTAQRACLEWAAAAITGTPGTGLPGAGVSKAGVPGVVLELGLGNGRTYDHLRERLPERTIYVFDRRIAAHPACIPPADRLFLGELAETLTLAAARLGRTAALIHADLGSGEAGRNAAQSALLGPLLAPLLVPGGIVLSDQPLSVPGWHPLPEPPGVAEGRYHLYRGE